jgi:ATP-binding cassette subfamily C protein CydC
MLTGVRRALPDSALVIALPDRHHDLIAFTPTRTLRLESGSRQPLNAQGRGHCRGS